MNTPKTIWIAGLLSLAALLAPAITSAQGSLAGRVSDALALTDRRIDQAESVVAEANAPSAANELALAKQIQGNARAAFTGNQFGLAERATLEARTHADRSIAIVRGLPDPDRVQVQVERTAELAERARERLADCNDNRARALLKVGLEMQARAETAAQESRYLAALQLTMSARERLFKAMRLCNVAESLSETAARAIQRTDQVLARARERLEESGSEQARKALDQAASMQAEAQSEYRSEHFEAALRLTHTARLLAQRTMRRGAPPGPGPGAPR